jgi:hypothetical protein
MYPLSPAVAKPGIHESQSSSRSRRTASLAGFFDLSQTFDVRSALKSDSPSSRQTTASPSIRKDCALIMLAASTIAGNDRPNRNRRA